MQRIFTKTLLAVLALMTIGFAGTANAQSLVLVIDNQQVWEETELGQDIERQLNELADNIGTQLSSRGEELQSEVEDLQRQRDEFIITDEVYEQRLAELQQQAGGLQYGAQAAEQAMGVAQRRAQNAFFGAILPDLSEEMDERGGTVLLDRTATLLSAEEVDITEEVIERVNGRITELEVELLPQRQAAEE